MAEYDVEETHTITLDGVDFDDIKLNGKTINVEISTDFVICINRKSGV